jgi:putative endonuclease
LAHIYILYSAGLDKYYVGHTALSVEERLRRHLADHKGYTAKTKDWAVVHVENFPTKTLAHRREREIKAWKSKQKIRELVLNGL